MHHEDQRKASATRQFTATCFDRVVFCVLAATLVGCRAASPDWNGEWKLNVPKSMFRDQTITVSISADGEYRYDDGFVSNPFRCDGEYRPILNNRTQNCVKSSANTLDQIRIENGVKTNTYHWELSARGNIFTITAITFRPSGPVITGQLVATRLSGSNDFAGKWKATTVIQPPPELTLRLDNQYLHISYPSRGQEVDVPLNGADAAVQGPLAPPGLTYSVLFAGRSEISILKKRNGVPFNRGSLKLSDDGGVVTESWWSSDRLGDASTFVYERKSRPPN